MRIKKISPNLFIIKETIETVRLFCNTSYSMVCLGLRGFIAPGVMKEQFQELHSLAVFILA